MTAEDIAATLRATETAAEGAAWLQELNLDQVTLVQVAAALGMTRVENLSAPQLRERCVRQAITARRKYDGLRKW